MKADTQTHTDRFERAELGEVETVDTYNKMQDKPHWIVEKTENLPVMLAVMKRYSKKYQEVNKKHDRV